MSVVKQFQAPVSQVRPLGLRVETIRWLWAMAQRSFPAIETQMRTPEAFGDWCMSKNVVLLQVADGVVMVDMIDEGVDCRVHPLFGRALVPRAERVRQTQECALYLYDVLGVHRIYGETPDVEPIWHVTQRFAQAVGFKYEGLKREAICIDGKWLDVHLQSLLLTDLPQGVINGWFTHQQQSEDGARSDADA